MVSSVVSEEENLLIWVCKRSDPIFLVSYILSCFFVGFEAHQNDIIMHPFHMLGAAGVFGDSLCSLCMVPNEALQFRIRIASTADSNQKHDALCLEFFFFCINS
jgi:hypothetical protein